MFIAGEISSITIFQHISDHPSRTPRNPGVGLTRGCPAELTTCSCWHYRERNHLRMIMRDLSRGRSRLSVGDRRAGDPADDSAIGSNVAGFSRLVSASGTFVGEGNLSCGWNGMESVSLGSWTVGWLTGNGELIFIFYLVGRLEMKNWFLYFIYLGSWSWDVDSCFLIRIR